MKVKPKRYRYAKWLSVAEMYEACKEWISKLEFIKDEQLFLNNLVKSYTLQLVDPNVYIENKKIINHILRIEKEVKPLLRKIRLHQNQLEIMVDNVNQLEMEKHI